MAHRVPVVAVPSSNVAPVLLAPGQASADIRCTCGKLLARAQRTVIEMKCSRCKRITLVHDGRRYTEPGAPVCHCMTGDD